MAYYIVTLHSPTASRYSGALGVVDSESGFKYLQIDDGSSMVQKHQLRGLSVLGDRVYVVTQASLRIYRIQGGGSKPVFKLVNEVVKEEWVIGQWARQGDLLPVHASKRHNRVYVGCNSLSSIDEFSLDGEFVSRRYLWEISADMFTPPEEIKGGFRYGHIRSISEDDNGRVVATIALIGGEDTGAVIDLDSGKAIIEGLYKPHGGALIDSSLYILDVEHARVQSFNNVFDREIDETVPDWTAVPEIKDPTYSGSTQLLRGMAVTAEELLCGAFHQGGRSDKQVPPRIVVFDASTHRQTREIYLPDIKGFQQPRVFSIAPLPCDHNLFSDDLELYINGESVPVEPVRRSQDRQNGKQELAGRLFSSKRNDKPESVKVEHISLHYRRQAHFFLSADRHLRKKKDFLALDDISFILYEGETVGIVGRNGSGKSTLSRLISGALIPDTGIINVNGRVQLLSLGLGFNNDLTGRENVYISGTLMGLSRKEVDEHLSDIEAFAELGEFMDEPVRTYSSGMRSRLGFAIATAVSPDVLILDEVMSTGDQSFRRRAQKRMDEMRESVKTVIIVSHSPAQVKKICTRALWFEKGRLMGDGDPRVVVTEYERFCQNPDKWLDRHDNYESETDRACQ